MKHVIPVMMRQGGGSIINISSIASIRHLGVSYVTYATTKAAMNQMTRTTAVEFAPNNVRVNAILPGLMKTPMVEHSAGLAASYAKGDVEAMWRARDAQVPMGHMGEPGTSPTRRCFSPPTNRDTSPGSSWWSMAGLR